MSDEHETRETPGARSFEERVFASFDSLDARLNGFETRLERLDGRLSALEDKAERRMQDTCPIWEQVNERLGKLETGVQEFRGESQANFRKVERQLNILAGDVIGVRDAMYELEARLDKPDKSPV
jgi:tetrahydromethanopterin S-methyltransferase subunit G